MAVRDASYYGRASWAGRHRLDGVDVADGELTNPFLHAIAGAIRLAEAEGAGAIAGTELELHRANPIDADDTSVARLVTSSGVTIMVAATVCASRPAEPEIIVHGTRGRATWRYERDEVLLDVGGVTRTIGFDRTDLLVNLIAHLNHPAEPPIVPLARTPAVAEFVDAVRRAPEPVPIAPGLRRAAGDEDTRRWVVDDVGRGRRA